MFLADFAVNQIWEELTDAQRESGIFFDPACGSGIFLVRLFQRLVAAHCLASGKRSATWRELSSIVRRLHGADINGPAVRIAAFSLYITLIDHSNLRDLDALIERGRLLPTLFGHTLQCRDFFATPDERLYDVVVGNPPWKGRAGQETTAHNWATAQRLPHPAKDIAWSFLWKSFRVVRPDGLVALLLPAMGTLHNPGSPKALQLLFNKASVHRIVNFSDLCFQIFDRVRRPTAFLLSRLLTQEGHPYRFEYWVPKADLNLRIKRTLTLSRADRVHLRSDLVLSDPSLFKRKLWARCADERLLQYLKTLPLLSSFIVESKTAGKAFDRSRSWGIGQGFQPAHDAPSLASSDGLRSLPYFAAKDFQAIALPPVPAKPRPMTDVRRAGFTAGFTGPHILIPQGFERSLPRLRAAYTEQSLCFEHSLQAIVFPLPERATAKLLTAILNSSLAAWFYFHETANFGTDRAKIQQKEVLKLPFGKPEAMPDPARSARAGERILALVDREIRNATQQLRTQGHVFNELDALVYDYFGLDTADIALIQDTIHYILPSIQPRRNAGIPAIWDASSTEQRASYAAMLRQALKPWFTIGISAALAARSADIAILKLTLDINGVSSAYTETGASDLEPFLKRMADHLPKPLSGNIQLIPDLRFAIGHDMYLVKPIQLRHWLRATALVDAEQIAADLSLASARTSDVKPLRVSVHARR